MSTEPFKLKDILYGLVIPILVAILILLFPTVIREALDSAFPPPDMMTGDPGSPYAFLTVIFTHGFAQMVMFGVPLILGLLWNKWAGGAAGFIMGTLYYVAMAGYNIMDSLIVFGTEYTPNLYSDPSFIGNYIVGGILAKFRDCEGVHVTSRSVLCVLSGYAADGNTRDNSTNNRESVHLVRINARRILIKPHFLFSFW